MGQSSPATTKLQPDAGRHYSAGAAAMNPAIETALLNKYNLTTLYPAAWPQEKDDADEDEDAGFVQQRPARRATAQPMGRTKSRYSVLEDRSRYSRQVPGAERSKDGVDNLVQKDEQDALGMYPSVVQVLRARNIQVEDDIKLRECPPSRPRPPAHTGA